ncbi:hypothetical protein Tco_0448907 [Tanacetum coccineum]
MVAYLEKSEGNADFHEIVDFLTARFVHYALTVSPTIYASYIKQFWNTAHSQTVNDVKQIHATVDGKTVVISESSMRKKVVCIKVGSTVVEVKVLVNPLKPLTAASTDQPELKKQKSLSLNHSSPQNTQSPEQALQEDT